MGTRQPPRPATAEDILALYLQAAPAERERFHFLLREADPACLFGRVFELAAGLNFQVRCLRRSLSRRGRRKAERDRTIVELDAAGYTAKEIGRHFSMTPDAVWAVLSRERRRKS